MEEKNSAAIQNIRSSSKQSVTSQRIFGFIKSALCIECELFQDCINRLEIDGRIYKKRGTKMLHFLLITLPQGSNKNDGPDNVQRVDKSPESPKTPEIYNRYLTMTLKIFKT